MEKKAQSQGMSGIKEENKDEGTLASLKPWPLRGELGSFSFQHMAILGHLVASEIFA